MATVPKSNRKIVQTEAKYIPMAHIYIYMWPLTSAWLCKVSSIKSDTFKLSYVPKTCLLVKWCCYAIVFHTWVKLKNNSTVFEELEVSIVDLTVANAVLLSTRSGASKTDICDRQIRNWHRQLFKYSTVIPILMKFSQCVHTSLKIYKYMTKYMHFSNSFR